MLQAGRFPQRSDVHPVTHGGDGRVVTSPQLTLILDKKVRIRVECKPVTVKYPFDNLPFNRAMKGGEGKSANVCKIDRRDPAGYTPATDQPADTNMGTGLARAIRQFQR
jgi:hypothetical protein